MRQAQKIEAIGQPTGGITHDFNNILAMAIGNLDLLRRRLIDGAFEGARRGAALTQRLLAFERRQDLKPKLVDVSALVDGMAELLERSLGPTITVATRFPPGIPRAHVDAN